MLEVEDISVKLSVGGNPIVLTGPVSFSVGEGEVFGLVGESGSGKSMIALALMRLTPAGTGVSGKALLGDLDLVAAPERAMRQVRGRDLGMIFQEPVSALNPVFTLESQLVSAIRAHLDLSRSKARSRAIELLGLVGSRSGDAASPVPASAFWRHVAARDDRDGAGLRR